jgi:hypothetical protein
MEIVDIFQTLGSIVGSVAGLAALFLYWKKIKKEEPEIIFHLVQSSYKVNGKSDLSLNLNIIFENKGNAPGSVTDFLAMIRYSEKALKMYPFILPSLNSLVINAGRPTNYLKIYPIEIGPYGSKKVNLLIKFSNVNIDVLDRCAVPINIREPKRWEWKDLPIFVKILVEYSKGKTEGGDCIFRDDLVESQEIRGTIDGFEYSEAVHIFTPKIEFD